MRIEIFLRAHGEFPPSVRKRFSFPRAIIFPSAEKELSCVGKDVFPRRKESLRSKEKDLRRVLKKANRGAGYTRPPIRFFPCSTAKSGATPVEGRWKRFSSRDSPEALVLLLLAWLGDEDETIRWDTSLEPLLELGLLGGGERFA